MLYLIDKEKNNIKQKILTSLFKSSNGLSAFTLFKRTGVSLPEFSKSIHDLTNKGLISEVNEDFFKLTELGTTQGIILETRKDKIWRKIPEQYSQSKISIDECYIPSIRLLDKKTFKNIKN